MDDVFLTVDEIAETLKLNPQNFRNWIDHGDPPAVRVGARRVRVRQSDLDAFVAAGATQAARKMSRYRFGLSDDDTSLPTDSGETTPALRFYEVQAASADTAVKTGYREWRKEVGRNAVAQSITGN